MPQEYTGGGCESGNHQHMSSGYMWTLQVSLYIFIAYLYKAHFTIDIIFSIWSFLWQLSWVISNTKWFLTGRTLKDLIPSDYWHEDPWKKAVNNKSCLYSFFQTKIKKKQNFSQSANYISPLYIFTELLNRCGHREGCIWHLHFSLVQQLRVSLQFFYLA